MRLVNALKADILFQFKQGFYYVYFALTILYIVVIGQLPDTIAEIAVPLVIFSDPSIVGFFFIGGIVMLEKVQGVLQYIVVTPLRSMEYLAAKLLSLTVLAVVAGFAIALTTYQGIFNWLLLFIGICLTSMFFTLLGFIVAAKCNSINQYFIKMIPYIFVIIVPCFLIIPYPNTWLLGVFPSVAGLKLVYGAFHGIGMLEAITYIFYLGFFNWRTFVYVDTYFNTRMV